MTRGFIVAIEDYPEATVVSRKLPGTIANANRFANWLEAELGVSQSDIIFCSSSKTGTYRTHGATGTEIRRALIELVNKGGNSTERLYVYLTGHGLLKEGQDNDEHTDLVLCSDFIDDQISGGACLHLPEMITWLTRAMGPGEHLWFVDVCRTSSQVINPVGLGFAAHNAKGSNVAKWYQVMSADQHQAALKDTLFIDTLMSAFDGDCPLIPVSGEPGAHEVTFTNVQKKVAEEFNAAGRKAGFRNAGADICIRTVNRPGTEKMIVDDLRHKIPPIELLATFDSVIFMGETNGQLPLFIEKAFALRDRQPWKRLDILSVEDLSEAYRPDSTLAELEDERAKAEKFFQNEALSMVAEVALYRYAYCGTYGSFWTADDGRRRAHASAGLVGMDIRKSPGSDYVDFEGMRSEDVDYYFTLADQTIARSKLIFRTPKTD